MRRLSLLLISAVMALTLVAVAAGVSGAKTAPGQQQPPDPSQEYGVLLESDTSLWWATGTAYVDAQQKADADCQAANDGPCVLAVWVQNGWAAYTQGENPDGTIAAFASWESTEQLAVDAGMQACQDAGATNCTSDAFQTAIDPSKPTTGGFKAPKPQSIPTSPR
jgi:hypothetical protein